MNKIKTNYCGSLKPALKVWESFICQIDSNIKTLVAVYVSAFGLLFTVYIFSSKYNIAIEKFTRDPAMLTDAHPFLGVISNIGILVWCSAAALCLFTASLYFNKNHQSCFMFFLSSGFLTSLLLFDDLFMLHESIFPKYLRVPETVTYIGYMILTLIYCSINYKFIIKTDFFILAFAFTFFGLSILSDIILPDNIQGIYLLFEDGFKLIGLASWTTYFWITCSSYIQKK